LFLLYILCILCGHHWGKPHPDHCLYHVQGVGHDHVLGVGRGGGRGKVHTQNLASAIQRRKVILLHAAILFLTFFAEGNHTGAVKHLPCSESTR